MPNFVFLFIVAIGGFVASQAGPWWARSIGTEYNPALVMVAFIGVAFMARGLLDSR